MDASFEIGLTSGPAQLTLASPARTSTHVEHDANVPVIITPIG